MDRKQNSTWREQTLTLPPRTVYDVVFPDTKPNHYHINNLSPATVYLGVAMLASPQSYDIAIPGNGDNIHARDLGVTRVTLYNDSPDKVRIVLTSFEEKFNPSVLAGRGGSVTVTGGGGGSGSGGVITGFTASLPSGANNIGKVVVTSMPTVDFALATLPPGTNTIGKVEVTKLPLLATDARGKIGNVGIDGGVTITSMPPVEVSNSPVRVSHFAWEDVVGTALVKIDSLDLRSVSYITNDGVTDVLVNFDSDANVATLKGMNSSIRLRAGETINDISRQCKSISLVRPEGTGTVRILGV